MQLDEGTGAEYNLFTLLSFSGNDSATNISSGNNIVTTSNIVDNENGVFMSNGSNHGHGIFSAVNINHNRGSNIDADGLVNGYTFSACHVYGDSSTTGLVRLRRSNGIHFSGGTIGATVVDDGGGVNVLFDNYSPEQTPFGITGNNAGALKEDLIFDIDRIRSDVGGLR